MREVRRADLVAAIGLPCSYCGEPMVAPTRDHVRPRSKGGGTLAQGKALACDRCNTDRGSRTLGSWLYRLRTAGDPGADIVAAFAIERQLICQHSAHTGDFEGSAVSV